jgi:hypothetical protein
LQDVPVILEGWKPLTVTAVVDVNVNQISLVSAVVAANLDSSISPPVQVCDLHVGGHGRKIPSVYLWCVLVVLELDREELGLGSV